MNDSQRFDLESVEEALFDLAISEIDEQYAYVAGYDSVINKPDEKNCNFRIFRTEKLTKAWEEGAKEARRFKSV